MYLLLLYISRLINSTTVASFAEQWLKRNDNLIGDSLVGAHLPQFLLQLYDRIPSGKIENVKDMQGELYHKTLAPLIKKKKQAWLPAHMPDDFGILRAYALIISSRYAKRFLKSCREQGFLTVSQLDDSPWSRSQKVFFFPLGPQLSKSDIQNIIKIVEKALTLIP